MLTSDDIKNLIKAQEEVFVTKTEFEVFRDEMRKDFSNLQSSVDSYAKKADTYFQEMLVLAHRVDRIEKWMKQIADKVGIKLEY